ncbi:MAG: two component, sigma54 specific, transcriptional regulator, Fis family [Fibrobacteres bacterium]|nr:two component, sigma54 specific, transcriptional regulator, Fis family [Fibrobacterota bacterium]
MKIFILDNDPELKKEVFNNWSIPNTEIMESSGGQNAIKLLTQGGISAMFLSTDFLTIENLDILDLAKERNPGIEVFILTNVRDTQKAEAAVQRGAHSFLIKPVNVKLLESLAAKALNHSLTRKNVRALEERYLEDLLGSSPTMKKILKTVTKVAPTNSTILISGESGTGKEFMANIVHRLSSRSDESFVAVNCGAIPETLVESELFGSRKGSYTGSIADRKGLFEMADKGTLFLDEIGELSLQTQVKLLRFLQDKEIRRVGDNENKYVDVRVIAASNKDLHKAIANGSFREDLYYRLSIFHLTLPPLRDRRSSIPSLIRTFVKKYSAQNKKQINGMAKSAEAVLMNYDYPGNIRQLENIIEHAVALCEGENIVLEDLPDYLVKAHGGPVMFALPKGEEAVADGNPNSLMTLAELEKNYIRKALEVCHKNHTEAARRLGISRSTLWRKLKEHGLEDAHAAATSHAPATVPAPTPSPA